MIKDDTDLWWKRGVIYQIYPRSFMDTNHDGIGDLKGIISKLDYLNDGTTNSLGVDAIWVSPIYKSPMKDFGYDISDYRDIDPIFGDMADFKMLIKEAHKRNIRVIMDLVVNHTSDKHPWFMESKKSKDNPKRDWYIWHGRRPNNWVAVFELRNAWWHDKDTGEYYLGTFTKHQPELNWRNSEVKKAIFNMIEYWLDLGVDGFRMDVINYLIKDDLLRNNPWKLSFNPIDVQEHIYDRNRPETHDICKEIRKITDKYEDRMLVGEIYTNSVKEAVAYHGTGNDELHLAFNFSFLFQNWSARGFYQNIKEYYNSLPKDAWPNFTLSNHDQPRHHYRYRAGKNTDARARVAAAMLMTLRGTPFIYYGEEIGMTNGKIIRKAIQDPLGKRGWPFIKGRDAERTPMQWDDTLNAGFSDTSTWLPVNQDYREKNVANQLKQEGSLINFYKRLIWLRKGSNALSVGSIEFLEKAPEQVLFYWRKYEHEQVIVILNFSDQHQILDGSLIGRVQIILGTHRWSGEEITLTAANKFKIYPYEVLLINPA
ncbi:alpha-amylase family glycosyl hydrolase [Desulforamulus aquiferis]|uniref:Alpha-amylase family glycosyl hydrolase n=2 Tax=Desulforamulus aquiferis TaxID=1397668 RepID=A0AAW7ZB94_9FIRM|nr:alpha-amylase family glycosyl hydrolase [Desulforamulus aquiferis]